MMKTQRISRLLTPLDAARGMLLSDLKPVAATYVALADAIGGIAADMPQQCAWPPFDTAVADGFALRASDLVGASSFSPVPLTERPAWVEAGDRMPDHCDCVLDADLVVQSGPMFQVVGEAIPGQGVRRAGHDHATGRSILTAGRRITPMDVMVARAVGLDSLAIRQPHVRVIDVPAQDGNTASVSFIVESARSAGARVSVAKASARDATAIATAIEGEGCDLVLVVGGTGTGRSDATVKALSTCGEVRAHGLALQPGRTAIIGALGANPVIGLPGAPDQALAVWLALAGPVLDRLTVRLPTPGMTGTLARKISSAVGFAEIVLLRATDSGWMPLAAGQFSLAQIAAADAWLMVAADSEGYAAGAEVGAFPLRNPV